MSKEEHKPTDRKQPKLSNAKLISSVAGGVFAILGLGLATVGIQSEGLTGSELAAMKAVAWVLAALAFVALAVRGGIWILEVWRARRTGSEPDEVEDPADPSRGDWLKRHRKSISATLILTALAAVALTVFQDQLGQFIDPECPDPTELTVQVPSEGAAAFTEVVEAFENEQRDDNECRTVSATALPVSWPEAQAAYASGWGADAQRLLGPRPEVWIAESAAQVEMARQEAADPAPLDDTVVSIGSTPLVLAVPPELDSGTDSAEEAFGALSGGDGPDVVRSDPELSFAGLHHLNWLYQLDLGNATVEDRIDAGFRRLGLGMMDDTDLLCGLYESGAAEVTAVLTTERAMALYNDAALGSDCPQPDSPTPFKALYPEQAGSLDYGAVKLDWSDPATADPRVEADRDGLAEDLVAWLSGPRGNAALAGIGIRVDHADPVLLDTDLGVDLNAALSTYGPQASLIPGLLKDYGEARKPTRVLLAIDTSGSMSDQTGPSGRSLEEAAKVGAAQALEEFGPNDEFGVWAFPDNGRMEPKELVGIGPADDDRYESAMEELDDLSPGGDTPLYYTIAEGVEELAADDGDEVQSIMVVLTDGENDDQVNEVGIGDLEAQLSQTQVQLYAITVGETDCEKTRLDDLAKASRGRCESVQARSLEETFHELLDQIWGGDV